MGKDWISVRGIGKTNFSSSSSFTTRLRFLPDPPLTLLGALVGVLVEVFFASLLPLAALTLFLMNHRRSEMARAVGGSR